MKKQPVQRQPNELERFLLKGGFATAEQHLKESDDSINKLIAMRNDYEKRLRSLAANKYVKLFFPDVQVGQTWISCFGRKIKIKDFTLKSGYMSSDYYGTYVTAIIEGSDCDIPVPFLSDWTCLNAIISLPVLTYLL